MKQPNLFSGTELRDQGIKTAEDHANNVHESWSDKAYEFLLIYIRNNKPFMTEDLRQASEGVVSEPPSLRAWGAVIVRAVKSGKIRRIGYSKVKNAKAHCTPASVWLSV